MQMAVSEQGQITPARCPSQAQFQHSYPHCLGLGSFPELGKMCLNKWHCWNGGEMMTLKFFQSQSFNAMNTICQHLPHVALTHLLPQKRHSIAAVDLLHQLCLSIRAALVDHEEDLNIDVRLITRTVNWCTLLRTDSAYCKYSPWVVTGKRLESTFKDKGCTVTLVQS